MPRMLAATQRPGRAPFPFVLGAVLFLGITACAESTPLEAPQALRFAATSSSAALPDRYIVQFDRGVADVPGLARQLTREHGGALHFTYTDVLRGFAATLPPQALEAIRRNPNVRLVEPDGVIAADGLQSGATWGLDRIDQRALPLGSTYGYDYTGAGVTAYIFDTGIRFDHIEFGGRARPGYDAFGDGRNGADCNGHGTHVAGTVGGQTYGVAKGVQLVSVRVLGCDGYGLYSGMIAGMDWVMKNRTGPAVANFSLGGSVSSSLNGALTNLINSGVQTAVSAGNDAGDACQQSPASTAAAVTVAATTSSDSRASYSNYGSCVDFFAPGSGITSASYGSSTGLVSMSGTSMAAPHAAGVLALLNEQAPGTSAQALRDWLLSLATKYVVADALSANAHLLYSRGAGTAPAGGSAPVTPPVTATAPTAPAGLTARQSGRTQVALAWSDRSANESGFRIERSDAGGAWLVTATVVTNATDWADAGVAVGASYQYRVSAINSAGASAPSNVAAVTLSSGRGSWRK